MLELIGYLGLILIIVGYLTGEMKYNVVGSVALASYALGLGSLVFFMLNTIAAFAAMMLCFKERRRKCKTCVLPVKPHLSEKANPPSTIITNAPSIIRGGDACGETSLPPS